MARGRKGDRGTDEFTKLYPSMIVDVLIPLPIDENENLDLPAQQEIAGKYESIELCKQELLDKLKMLIEQKVTLY
jgi:hypothetical protein